MLQPRSRYLKLANTILATLSIGLLVGGPLELTPPGCEVAQQCSLLYSTTTCLFSPLGHRDKQIDELHVLCANIALSLRAPIIGTDK